MNLICILILIFVPQLSHAAVFKVITNNNVSYSNKRLENSTRIDSLDERWKLLSEDSITEDRLYFDSKSIKKNGKTILVWAMRITDNETSKSYYEFHCQSNNYLILQIENTKFDNEEKFIVPDSEIEQIFNAVCRKN